MMPNNELNLLLAPLGLKAVNVVGNICGIPICEDPDMPVEEAHFFHRGELIGRVRDLTKNGGEAGP
jgi:hypothetical protein